MAKKGNHIALELKALERKADELKDYLDKNKFKNIADFNERHQEIKIQLLIMKELGPIVQQLDVLRKQADKTTDDIMPTETRGDVPLSPLEEGLI